MSVCACLCVRVRPCIDVFRRLPGLVWCGWGWAEEGRGSGAAAGFGIPHPVVNTCYPIERHKTDRDVRMQACVQVASACEDALASGLPHLSPRPCPSLPSHRRQRRQQHIPCMNKVQNINLGQPPRSKVFRQTPYGQSGGTTQIGTRRVR